MFKEALNKIQTKVGSTVDLTKETLDNVSLPIKTRKVAITGLSKSGKTVFITSLIDQLLHQKKISLVTSKNKKFKVTLEPPKSSIKRFDYYSFCKNIKSNSTWPKGTDDITSTILEFESKASFSLLGNSKFRLELIDYPGEWILDIALLGTTYENWSEDVITWMKTLNEPLADEYLKDIDKLSTSTSQEDEHILHVKYSNMLCYFKDNHYANLTPGRFLMPSDLADDPILCFAPIPKSDSNLHDIYKKRYTDYLKEIVTNIQLEHFKGFDKQIVLIDVIESLQNGSQCYEDMKAGLKQMLSLYNHKDKNFISQFFSPSINDVTFVATKADLVASSQHNNYLALLDEMVEELRRELDVSHIKTNTQAVASIKCTQTVMAKHEGKTLSCIRGIDSKSKNTVEIYPGEMPSTFPFIDEWNPDNYAFEEFLPPKKQYKDNEAFDHIHMDRVIEAIIGDLL